MGYESEKAEVKISDCPNFSEGYRGYFVLNIPFDNKSEKKSSSIFHGHGTSIFYPTTRLAFGLVALNSKTI